MSTTIPPELARIWATNPELCARLLFRGIDDFAGNLDNRTRDVLSIVEPLPELVAIGCGRGSYEHVDALFTHAAMLDDVGETERSLLAYDEALTQAQEQDDADQFATVASFYGALLGRLGAGREGANIIKAVRQKIPSIETHAHNQLDEGLYYCGQLTAAKGGA